jgi:hypothetical protein
VSDEALGLDLGNAGVRGMGFDDGSFDSSGVGRSNDFGSNAAASDRARAIIAFGKRSDSAVSYRAVARIASGIRSQSVENAAFESSFIESDGCSNVVKVNSGKGRDRVSSALALGRATVASRNDGCSRSGRNCSGSSDPCRTAIGGSRGRGLVQRKNQNAVGHDPAKPSASSRSIRFPRNNFVTWLV